MNHGMEWDGILFSGECAECTYYRYSLDEKKKHREAKTLWQNLTLNSYPVTPPHNIITTSAPLPSIMSETDLESAYQPREEENVNSTGTLWL